MIEAGVTEGAVGCLLGQISDLRLYPLQAGAPRVDQSADNYNGAPEVDFTSLQIPLFVCNFLRKPLVLLDLEKRYCVKIKEIYPTASNIDCRPVTFSGSQQPVSTALESYHAQKQDRCRLQKETGEAVR